MCHALVIQLIYNSKLLWQSLEITDESMVNKIHSLVEGNWFDLSTRLSFPLPLPLFLSFFLFRCDCCVNCFFRENLFFFHSDALIDLDFDFSVRG